MRLLVGLGNPGPRYQGTRHNLGFEAVGLLARRHGIELGRKKFSSRFGRGRMAGRDVLLAQPQTYMNLSGGAVSQIAAYFGLGLEDVLVLHDDLDVELDGSRSRPGAEPAATRAWPRLSIHWAGRSSPG